MNKCYSPLHLQRQLQRQLSQDNQRRLGLSIPEEEDCDSQDEVTTRSGPCLASRSAVASTVPSSLAAAFSLDSSSGISSKFPSKTGGRSKRRLSDSMCSLLNAGVATSGSVKAGRSREKLSLSSQLLSNLSFNVTETSSSGSITAGRPRVRRSSDMSGGITAGRPVRGGRYSETSAPRIDLLDTSLELLHPVLSPPSAPWGSNTSSSNSVSSGSSSSTSRLAPLVPSSMNTSGRSTAGGITAGLPVCLPCDTTLPSIVSGLPVCNSTVAGITSGVPMTHLRGSNSYGIVSGIPPFLSSKSSTVFSDTRYLPVSPSLDTNSNLTPGSVAVPGIMSGIPVRKPSHDSSSSIYNDNSDMYNMPRPLQRYPSRSSLVNETSSPGLVQSLNEMEISDDASPLHRITSSTRNASSYNKNIYSSSAYSTNAYVEDNLNKSNLLESDAHDSPMDDINEYPLSNPSVSSSIQDDALSAPSPIINFDTFYPGSEWSDHGRLTNVPSNDFSTPAVEALSAYNSSFRSTVNDFHSSSSPAAAEALRNPELSSHENIVASNLPMFSASSSSVIQYAHPSSTSSTTVGGGDQVPNPEKSLLTNMSSSSAAGLSGPATVVCGSSDQGLKDLLLSWQKSQPGFSSISTSGHSSPSSSHGGSLSTSHSKQQSPYQRPRAAGKHPRQRRTGLATLLEIPRPSERLSPAPSPGLEAARCSPAPQRDEALNN